MHDHTRVFISDVIYNQCVCVCDKNTQQAVGWRMAGSTNQLLLRLDKNATFTRSTQASREDANHSRPVAQRIHAWFCFHFCFEIYCQFDISHRPSCSHILPPALEELHLSSTRKQRWLRCVCMRVCVCGFMSAGRGSDLAC